ncbi:hypothetical protein V494_00327 [Pseudogymnoascus sp. VKM F-4513 (FW-928)]|nr:hypothetical protein V494_00327 [Pseudogymnoascus sp. VKM F-4513 (FW-928)]
MSFYYVIRDYRPESVSSKAEIWIPNKNSQPERLAMRSVPSLEILSKADNIMLESRIISLRQNNQEVADVNNTLRNQDVANVDHTSLNQHMADLDQVSLNQDMADIDRASHTYSDNGDKGNVTLRSMARKLLYCVCPSRMTSKAYVMC